jgi:arylsulfatase A-like enzyme
MKTKLLTISLFLIAAFAGAVEQSSSKPNIIFFLADDLAYCDMSCFGQTNYATPNIDRLATEGRVFASAYAGGAWCAPSRTALLTGRNALHCAPVATDVNGCGTKFNPTVAEMLKTAGYATFACGKWHMMEPSDTGLPSKPCVNIPPAQLPWNRGFDVCRITQLRGALGMSFPHEIWTGDGQKNSIPENMSVTEESLAQNRISKRDAKAYNAQGLFVDATGKDSSQLRYGEELLREEAVAFMRANRRKPFFLYYASPLVHRPLIAKDIGHYLDKPAWKLCHKIHAAMVEELDRSVGTLLAEVRKLGLEKNTIILFASDNGFTSEGWWGVGTQNLWDDIPLFHIKGPWHRGKHINTDGGVTVPFIAWGPGRVVPGKTDRAISFHDFMATMAEIAGAKLPGPTDSVSFVPLLDGRDKDHPPHPPILWCGFSCIYGTMPDDWATDRKQSYRPDATLLDEHFFAMAFRNKSSPPTIRIFNTTTDPGMKHDIAADHPDIYDRAKAEFQKLTSTGNNSHLNHLSKPSSTTLADLQRDATDDN